MKATEEIKDVQVDVDSLNKIVKAISRRLDKLEEKRMSVAVGGYFRQDVKDCMSNAILYWCQTHCDPDSMGGDAMCDRCPLCKFRMEVLNEDQRDFGSCA